jgi:hypothetical protein
MKKTTVLAAAAILSLVTGASDAVMASSKALTVKPTITDPKRTGSVRARFVKVGTRNALMLQKSGATDNGASAGADIQGTRGMKGIQELGYDVQGWCGETAPRFVVQTIDGSQYNFTCQNGTHTTLSDGWTQIRYSRQDGVPVMPDGLKVASISIVFDEGTDITGNSGLVYIDNVEIDHSVARDGMGR